MRLAYPVPSPHLRDTGPTGPFSWCRMTALAVAAVRTAREQEALGQSRAAVSGSSRHETLRCVSFTPKERLEAAGLSPVLAS